MATMMDFSDVLLDEFDMLEQEMENYDNAFELNDDSLLFDLLDQLLIGCTSSRVVVLGLVSTTVVCFVIMDKCPSRFYFTPD
jgi:hypothetical protein